MKALACRFAALMAALALGAPSALAQDRPIEPCAGETCAVAAPGVSRVDVRQVGDRNITTVEAPNPDQSIAVSQQGDRNRAEVSVEGLGAAQLALGQIGDENRAAFVLANPGAGVAGVRAFQVGARNRIELEQAVTGLAFASIEQQGEGNRIELEQEGENLSAELAQFGDFNRLSVEQTGADLGVKATQIGSGLPRITIEQIGAGLPGAPPITVTQVR